MKKLKKGFTLIELLAVMAILGILALISTAVVKNVIAGAHKRTFEESVRGILRAAENYIDRYHLETGMELEYPDTFICNSNGCSDGINTLDFGGVIPSSGSIVIEGPGHVVAQYLSDGTHCVYGTKNSLQVEDNCGKLDVTKPTVTGKLEVNVLKLIFSDSESGIDSYAVKTSNDSIGANWISIDTNSVFHTLDRSGTYYVFAKDKKGNISDSLEFITGDIERPQVTGIFENKTIKIDLSDDIGVTAYCITTSSCTWIETRDTHIEKTITVSGTYYIFAKDAQGNISEGLIITTGDIEKPIVSAELNGKVVNITLEDNIGTTAYCVNETAEYNLCNWQITNDDYIEHTLSSAGTYYIFAKDAANNISDYVTIEAPSTAFCAFNINEVVETIGYTGAEREWIVPCDGSYKIQVIGGKGGGSDYRYGDGCAWSYGVASWSYAYTVTATYNFTADDILKVKVGGAGGGGLNCDCSSYHCSSRSGGGGWNGGSAGASGGGGSGGKTEVYQGDTKLLEAKGGNGYVKGWGDYSQDYRYGAGTNTINTSVDNYIRTDASASQTSLAGQVIITLIAY